ncbi:hypothetical protein TcWFU_010124 [Taenia crassiceps]|uniref:Uncharacterized protein n=1 Tax=Taenia crassiceps TaxID=6207 RepID=A0ABR4QF41_9CEST
MHGKEPPESSKQIFLSSTQSSYVEFLEMLRLLATNLPHYSSRVVEAAFAGIPKLHLGMSRTAVSGTASLWEPCREAMVSKSPKGEYTEPERKPSDQNSQNVAVTRSCP